MMNLSPTKIVSTVFSIVGPCMLIGALLFFWNTQNFINNSESTNGTVIDLVQSRTDSGVVYKPVVEFQTQDGSTIEFTSMAGTNPPQFSTGDSVSVYYKESSPNKARLNSFFSLWGLSLIFGGIGLIFSIVGFSMRFFVMRQSYD